MRKYFACFFLLPLFTACSTEEASNETDAPAMGTVTDGSVEISENKYGLEIVENVETYKKMVAADPDKQLINLEEAVPGVVMDIKYATDDNIVEEPVYKLTRAYARKPVAEALIDIQNQLAEDGYGLKIFDGYRPYSVTVHFYDEIQDSVFLAVPWEGSRHNRGCAVDISLVDLATGKELEMPTAYDDFTERAHPGYEGLPENLEANRDYLINIMNENGFTVYPSEWWHFDFVGWENYELMDISFEELEEL